MIDLRKLFQVLVACRRRFCPGGFVGYIVLTIRIR
jgi:hypothetical protein